MEKKNLLQVLKLLRPALGSNIIKGLDSYIFTGNQVSAFNGSLCMTACLDEIFPVTGAIVGEPLVKLLSELDKEIELTAPDANTLLIKAGRSRTKFPVEQVDTSYLQDLEETTAVNLPTQVMFAAGVKRCMTSLVGKGATLENAGIHIFIENDECRMYSTNNSTFSRFVFPLTGMSPISMFLPATFCEVLLAVYAELGTEPETIIATDKYIRARFGNLTVRNSFYANPVNTDLRNLIDAGVTDVAIVDLPKALSEAIKHSEVITNEGVVSVSWIGEQGKMFINAQGSKSQELVEEIELAYPGTGELKFDIKNLRKVMDTCKEIGFGDDYMLLIGAEKYFDHVVMSRQ